LVGPGIHCFDTLRRNHHGTVATTLELQGCRPVKAVSCERRSGLVKEVVL
jgi:hypothetical protein